MRAARWSWSWFAVVGFAAALLALLVHTELAPPGAALASTLVGGPWLAVDALVHIAPTPSPSADIDDDGVILTKLDVWLAPGATEKALQDVLAAEHAAIASSRPGNSTLTLWVPRAASVDAMRATAQRLQATGVFTFVEIAHTRNFHEATDRTHHAQTHTR